MHFFVMFSFIPFVLSIVLLVLSAVGRWRIFSKNGFFGLLSLIPGVNLIIYGLIAKRLKSVIGMLVLSIGLSLAFAVMGSAIAMTMSSPALQGKATSVCIIAIAVLSILFFVLYVFFIAGLCESLSVNKLLFIPLFMFFFPLAEVIVGFSGGSGGSGIRSKPARKKKHSRTSSLESYMENSEETDNYMEIWDSGAVTFPEDMEI